VTRRAQPHGDDRSAALAHFNDTFRHRYSLPALTAESLSESEALDEPWADIPQIRANGVLDASCAVLARIALSVTPRYAIGFLDGADQAHVQSPMTGDDAAYRSHHVLMINPLGGVDNWKDVARWVHQIGGEKARRVELAGRASEERPDHEANARLLRSKPDEMRAIVLPPDEAFSVALAAEVSFIYDVPVDTLRAWKLRYRRELASGKPGAPRNR
jgi:hypothetical protein